jgi:prepilin-type N-terminal cleavage/methylation domain-containing protein
MNTEGRRQKTEDRKQRTAIRHRGFTLIEIVVAIGILVMVVGFSGVIFQRSIGAYRTAMAQTEIMRKLRVITEQLDSDFQGLQKDGFLILYSQVISRNEYATDAAPGNFMADRVYFFCTGEFQSWFRTNLISNIARVYLGHDRASIGSLPTSQWRLARDVNLLCPGELSPPIDVNTKSYAEWKADVAYTLSDADSILINNPPVIDVAGDPNTVRNLFCENAGELKIEWTDGTLNTLDNSLAWFGLMMPRKVGLLPGIPGDSAYSSIEPIEPPSSTVYRATWQPSTQTAMWPKALKFTFTLYDSRRMFPQGQTFSHIVYLGD